MLSSLLSTLSQTSIEITLLNHCWDGGLGLQLPMFDLKGSSSPKTRRLQPEHNDFIRRYTTYVPQHENSSFHDTARRASAPA
jgi:hypothetical protein